ncbi:putative sodium bile acid cotransporter [Rosa chinensis]|uniref:Putative sodium bile acid cotransporter n=1 Tax=Rosa chinensis TaxID=74649 RepID=A0A2P6SBT3_ROSCH|nr:putative sodium bile acid cotransporter [Rosa chinensis]
MYMVLMVRLGNSCCWFGRTYVLNFIMIVILVPWMQVTRSRSVLLMVNPAVFLGAVGMGVLLHLILLAFNAVAVKSLSALSGGSESLFFQEGKCKCCSPCCKPENTACNGGCGGPTRGCTW